MNFFREDAVGRMTPEELERAASGSGVGVLAHEQSTRLRAAERLHKLERPFSVRPHHAGPALIGGEVVRLGVTLGVRNPIVKSALQRAGLGLDAGGNTFGANSSTDAGDDPYNRVRMENGGLEKVARTGTDASSQITNLMEGLIGALQFTGLGTIPATMAAGEMTESQIHEAERNNAKVLAQIAAREGDYANVENAVKAIDMLNAAQEEPGKISGVHWTGLRADKQALINRHLGGVREAIESKDQKRIEEASQIIPLLAEYMDEFNADMEAVQTSSQEITWPMARFGEFIADEVPNTKIKHFLNPDRLLETVFAGNVQNHGLLDYLNPSGKNMQQYVNRRNFNGADERVRVQGGALRKELSSRALKATNGVDPVKFRDAKQKQRADNFSVADPGYGLYQ